MKTYKQFIAECNSVLNEQPSSAFLGFSKRLGSGVGSGNVGVNASVSGGGSKPGSTQYSAGGSLQRGEFSGQGDRVSRGIDAALSNYNSGTNAANTSTSTISKGTRGSFSANVSGSVGGGQPKPVVQKTTPEPQSVKPKTKPKQTKDNQPPVKINRKNYAHADPVVDAKLRKDPKLMDRAVQFARTAQKTGNTKNSNFYNNAIVGGTALNRRQARMTSQSREMAGNNAVAGSSFTYGRSSDKNDYQAHKAQYKDWKASQQPQQTPPGAFNPRALPPRPPV